jgi:hypothetical protein
MGLGFKRYGDNFVQKYALYRIRATMVMVRVHVL